MLNKNVADYTNFDGKTNKKIVQAPGGASSLNFGWSDQKTDYGPQRRIRKESQQNYQQSYTSANQNPPKYSEPMRVMEEIPSNYARGQVSPGYGNQQRKIGGQYGYNGYSNSRQNTDGGYGQQMQSKPGSYGGYNNPPVDQLDRALQQEMTMRNQRPPSVPQSRTQNEGRSCIKINAPARQNSIFGGNDYNYWKEDTGTSQKKVESQKRINYQQYQAQQPTFGNHVTGNSDKPSVRVHNPPGGKQSFTLG